MSITTCGLLLEAVVEWLSAEQSSELVPAGSDRSDETQPSVSLAALALFRASEGRMCILPTISSEFKVVKSVCTIRSSPAQALHTASLPELCEFH